MAFELKKFTAADEALYKSFKIVNPLRVFVYPDEWIVDIVRDAYCVVLGGRGNLPQDAGEPPTYNVLVLNERNINFETHERLKRISEEDKRCNWHVDITRISMPKDFEVRGSEIESLIAEALLVYIKSFHGESVKEVKATFCSPVYY